MVRVLLLQFGCGLFRLEKVVLPNYVVNINKIWFSNLIFFLFSCLILAIVHEQIF